MTEDLSEVFALAVEFKGEGPLLMEALARGTSFRSARDAMRVFEADPRVVRVAIVRLEYASGNELLLHDMKRMQA